MAVGEIVKGGNGGDTRKASAISWRTLNATCKDCTCMIFELKRTEPNLCQVYGRGKILDEERPIRRPLQ